MKDREKESARSILTHMFDYPPINQLNGKEVLGRKLRWFHIALNISEVFQSETLP